MSLPFLLHYSLHLVLPVLVAVVFFRKDWKRVSLILLATMLVDLDHLLATPIYQADRCSINFHLLHSHVAIILYVILLLFRKPMNLIGLGLLMHMATDALDCYLMNP